MSYLGVVLLISVMVAAIASTSLGSMVTQGIKSSVCKVMQNGGCSVPSPAGSPAPAKSPDCSGRDDRTNPGRREGDRRARDKYPDQCNAPSSPKQPTDTAVGTVQTGTNGTDPGPPPVPPHDAGSGPFGSEKPNASDFWYKEQLYLLAQGADLKGFHHAATNMRHFLDGTGKPLTVDPQEMIGDLPGFKAQLGQDLAKLDCSLYKKATSAFRGNDGRPINMSFQGPWMPYYAEPEESQDWFYAIGGFTYEISGYVTVEPPDTPGAAPKVVMHYRVHVHDRYNWDTGKSVDIGPIHIPDTAQQRLHRTGLAQEYDINGSTDLLTRAMSSTCVGTADNGPSGKQSRR